MKLNRLLFYIMLVLLVVTTVLIVVVDAGEVKAISLLTGIFTGAFIGACSSLIGYFNEKRQFLANLSQKVIDLAWALKHDYVRMDSLVKFEASHSKEENIQNSCAGGGNEDAHK